MRFSPNNLQPAARACISMRDLGMSRARKNPTTYHWYPLIPSRADHTELPTDIHWYLFFSWQFSQSRPPTPRSVASSLASHMVFYHQRNSQTGQTTATFNLSPGRGGPLTPLTGSARQPRHSSSPNWIPNWSASSRVRCCEVPWYSKTWRASPCLCTSWHGQPFPVLPSHRVSVIFWVRNVELGRGCISGIASVGNNHIVHHILYIYIYYIYICIYINLYIYICYVM